MPRVPAKPSPPRTPCGLLTAFARSLVDAAALSLDVAELVLHGWPRTLLRERASTTERRPR